jgi:hypothetical protein
MDPVNEPVVAIPIIDISAAVDNTDPLFSTDVAFYDATLKRREEMMAFMIKLGISQMRTQIQNSQGTWYRLLVHLV